MKSAAPWLWWGLYRGKASIRTKTMGVQHPLSSIIGVSCTTTVSVIEACHARPASESGPNTHIQVHPPLQRTRCQWTSGSGNEMSNRSTMSFYMYSDPPGPALLDQLNSILNLREKPQYLYHSCQAILFVKLDFPLGVVVVVVVVVVVECCCWVLLLLLLLLGGGGGDATAHI